MAVLILLGVVLIACAVLAPLARKRLAREREQWEWHQRFTAPLIVFRDSLVPFIEAVNEAIAAMAAMAFAGYPQRYLIGAGQQA